MKKILTLVLFTITIILDGNADIIKLSKEYEKNSTSYTINAHYNKLRDYNNSNWPYDRKSVNLASIKVEKGEELTFKNAHILSNITTERNNYLHGAFKLELKYPNFSNKTDIYVYYSGSTYGWRIKEPSYKDNIFTGTVWPIMGPAEIKVSLMPTLIQEGNTQTISQPQQLAQIFFEKKIANYAQPREQLQALVLPKGANGMSVIMESSEDLINWTRDTPGKKPNINRQRFFRIRAVKE